MSHSRDVAPTLHKPCQADDRPSHSPNSRGLQCSGFIRLAVMMETLRNDLRLQPLHQTHVQEQTDISEPSQDEVPRGHGSHRRRFALHLPQAVCPRPDHEKLSQHTWCHRDWIVPVRAPPRRISGNKSLNDEFPGVCVPSKGKYVAAPTSAASAPRQSLGF